MIKFQRASSSSVSGAPVALVLPGAGYTVQAPLLYWSVLALVEAGWDVWSIDWHNDIDEDARQDMQGFVEAALARAEEHLPAQPELVIAKSLGTFALPYFAERQVRAAWLTPILTDPAVANALGAVTPGRHLAVGGTSDPSWRPDLVGPTHAQFVSIQKANHSLELPLQGWRESVEAQRKVVGHVITHLASP